MATDGNRNQRWIGLAEVRPANESPVLRKGLAAFVPVVGDAISTEEFWNLAQQELSELELHLIKITDLEPLSARRLKHKLSHELDEAITQLSPKKPLVFGIFEAFKEA